MPNRACEDSGRTWLQSWRLFPLSLCFPNSQLGSAQKNRSWNRGYYSNLLRCAGIANQQTGNLHKPANKANAYIYIYIYSVYIYIHIQCVYIYIHTVYIYSIIYIYIYIKQKTRTYMLYIYIYVYYVKLVWLKLGRLQNPIWVFHGFLQMGWKLITCSPSILGRLDDKVGHKKWRVNWWIMEVYGIPWENTEIIWIRLGVSIWF